MRILYVDTDDYTADSIRQALVFDGAVVDKANARDDEILSWCRYQAYDAIVFSESLTDVWALRTITLLRREKIRAPIIALGYHRADTRVKHFDAGADDYVLKPFHVPELTARLRCLVRRANGHADPVLEIGDISVNTNEKKIFFAGRYVHLTNVEYKMFELMALRSGKVLTKQMFMDHAYGGRDEPDMKIINVFLCHIRSKLRAIDPNFNGIETVWGRGYMLVGPKEPELRKTEEKTCA